MPLFSRNPTLLAMIATAPGAAPKADLRRAVGRERAILAQEREALSNLTPAGPEPAPRTASVQAPEPAPRTVSVQAPGPAQSPTLVVRASGMKALPQARPRAKARLLRQRPWVARDPPQQRAAVPPERPPPAAEQPWGQMAPEPRRQHSAFRPR